MPPRARTCKAAPQTAAVSDAPTLAAHIHRDLAPTCFEVCLGCERTSGAGWGVSAGRKAAVTKTDRTRSPRRARSRAAAAAAARPLPPPPASCSSQARTPVQTRLGTSARAGGEARLGAPAELRARGSRAAPRRRRAPAAAPPGPCRSRGGRSAGEAGTWPRAQRCPQLRSSSLVYYLHRRLLQAAGLRIHCRRRVRVDMHAPCPRRAKALRHGGAAPGQQQPRARVARRLR